MGYDKPSSGQVLVPSAQYVSPGTNFTSPINPYPTVYQVSQNNPAPAPDKNAPSYSYTSALLLGVVLVCDGALAMAGSVMAIIYYAFYYEVGTGLWCGAMFMFSGAVAIAAGCNRTICYICATTVTSVLAVIFAITLGILSGWGFSCDAIRVRHQWYELTLWAQGMMFASACVAGVLGFSLSIVGCVTLCTRSGPQVVPVQYITVAPQSMGSTATPNQQQVLSVPVYCAQLPTAQNHPLTTASVFQGPKHHNSQQSNDRHRDALALI